MKKIVAGAFVTAMIAAIVIGVVLLVTPSAQAQGGAGRRVTQEGVLPGRGNGGQAGRGGGGGALGTDELPALGVQEAGDQGRGYGAQGDRGQGGQGQGGQGGQGQSGTANPAGEPQAELEEWVTIEGTVVQTLELVVETADGETVQVGLGPSHYRDAQGFVLSEGDQVRVSGYWEEGEFKAGEVENLSTGDTITLRDAYGRPMWSGRGRRDS